MRLRNVRGAREAMIDSKYTVNEPEQYKGRWNEFFGNNNPIRLEIGTGKGKFLMTLAAQNPDINYIGIEKYSSVLVRALEKQNELELPNVVFIRMDAEHIEEIFANGEIDRIYLNFSDPWPKDRHAKRRLTSRQFLPDTITFWLRTDVLSSRRITERCLIFPWKRLRKPAGS